MSSKKDTPQEEVVTDQAELGFVSHLFELRDRLIRVVLVILVLFGVAFTFWIDVYDYLSAMVRTLDGNSDIKWQNISPAGGFFTAIRISMAAAFFIGMPYIFFQLWKFVSPGLYQHERKLIVPILFGGIVLFYLGILFARYVVLPIFYGFAGLWIPSNTENIYDIMKYLTFNIKMFFAFGISFQVPIVTIALVWGGISTPESLKEKRPYVIVGAFVIGMLLTPPDVVSQILLAIPMWLLYEAGIIVSKAYYKPGDDDSEESDEPENPDDNEPPPGAGGSGAVPGSAAAAAAAADSVAEINGNKTPSDEVNNGEQTSNENDSDEDEDKDVEEESLVISSEGGTGVEDLYEYKPLSEDELDAELDRFDDEMEALEADQAQEEQDSEPSPGDEPENSTAEKTSQAETYDKNNSQNIDATKESHDKKDKSEKDKSNKDESHKSGDK